MTLQRSITRSRRFMLTLQQQATMYAVIAALSLTTTAGSHNSDASKAAPQFMPFEVGIEPTLLLANTAAMPEPARGPTLITHHDVQRSNALTLFAESWHAWSQSIGLRALQISHSSINRFGRLWKRVLIAPPPRLVTATPVGFFVESGRAAWEAGNANSLCAEDARPLTLRVNHAGGWNEAIKTRIEATVATSPGRSNMAVSVAMLNQKASQLRIEALDWGANRFIGLPGNGRFSDGDRFVRSDGRVELRILFNARAGIMSEQEVLAIDQVSIEFNTSP